MSLRPCRFKLGEEVSFTGKPMRVAGLVQFEGANAQLVTRYLLADSAGAPQILEESEAKFSLLRPFPPTAQPQTAGNVVTVMGEKYALKGVRKLKVLGAEGQPPGAVPRSELLLSGLFEGQMGILAREMAPGAATPAAAQAFYSLKPVPATEVLSGEQLAAKQEAERLAAEAAAQAAEEEEDSGKGGMLQKAVSWIVTILVILGLGYACAGSEEEDSSTGSARSSFRVGGGFGGK